MKNKKGKYIYLWQICSMVYRCSPYQFACYIILTVLLGCIPTVLVVFESKFIDTAIMIVTQEKGSSDIIGIIAVMIAILSFLWLSKSMKGILSVYIKTNISRKINIEILDKKAALKYAAYENIEIQNLIKRVSKEPDKTLTKGFENLLSFAACIITSIGTLGLTMKYAPAICVVVMALSFLLFAGAVKSGTKNYEATAEALALERYSDYYGNC